jgi:predicted amidophosphoribosyltransferase
MLTRKQVEYVKGIGEIYSDFDLPEDTVEVCPVCESELEWNGFCSECGYPEVN